MPRPWRRGRAREGVRRSGGSASDLLSMVIAGAADVLVDQERWLGGGTANRIDHALELRQEAVARVLYDPAPVFPYLRIDQLPEMSFEAFVRPFLILAHQARVPGHVGGEDCSEATDRRHCSPGDKVS